MNRPERTRQSIRLTESEQLEQRVRNELLRMFARICIVVGRVRFSWSRRGVIDDIAWPKRDNLLGRISATLVFGNTSEQCFIPDGAVLSIFSPELSAQFSVSPKDEEGSRQDAEKAVPIKPGAGERGKKVVQVDFQKKKQ